MTRRPPQTWVMERESKELVVLETYVAGAPTNDYTVACLPHGPSSTDYADPTIIGGGGPNARSGYMADGMALGGEPGLFNIYVIFDTAPEEPERLAAILRLV